MKNIKFTMQDLIESILKLAEMNQENRKREDVFRTNGCAAAASGRAYALALLGFEYDLDSWMDGEFEMIEHFYVDGVTLIKNGEIDWEAYSDAVVDEEHGWERKELTVQERI